MAFLKEQDIIQETEHVALIGLKKHVLPILMEKKSSCNIKTFKTNVANFQEQKTIFYLLNRKNKHASFALLFLFSVCLHI